MPDSRFEFVIASSEYMVRKPNPRIFRLALQKAGLSPDRVWFCGDNVRADVEGAHAAGLFPVWYEGESGRARITTSASTRWARPAARACTSAAGASSRSASKRSRTPFPPQIFHKTLYISRAVNIIVR